MVKTARVSVRVEPEIMDTVEAIARMKRVKTSAVVREALAMYITATLLQNQPQLLRSTAVGSSTQPTRRHRKGPVVECPKCGQKGRAFILKVKAKGYTYYYHAVDHSDGRRCTLGRIVEEENEPVIEAPAAAATETTAVQPNPQASSPTAVESPQPTAAALSPKPVELSTAAAAETTAVRDLEGESPLRRRPRKRRPTLLGADTVLSQRPPLTSETLRHLEQRKLEELRRKLRHYYLR
ncbi:MAG: ribbon-helix-helix domain-containing protein [Thermosphaera sp.]